MHPAHHALQRPPLLSSHAQKGDADGIPVTAASPGSVFSRDLLREQAIR
ncbi:hypothetical protein trd_A0523 (plasmid) [Thermomicrobium roseum DSM 5159]|uniref:Uncharacterized protein n=1 Tax=Thermomicrobium roseum (strain ATCC 27502 / DSM 5159 / P-2) TaxID=309801 RepID=B9L410_THERP|nr:hypothetical protein trd_A0523 [Thermomicrobium roseum DSM 5159]